MATQAKADSEKPRLLVFRDFRIVKVFAQKQRSGLPHQTWLWESESGLSHLTKANSSSRNKKPRVTRIHDESVDPEISCDIASDAQDESCLALGDLEDPFVTSLKTLHARGTNRGNVPAKGSHGLVPIYKADIHKDTVLPCENDREILQVPTPQTPRHRAALSKKIPITPRRTFTPAGRISTPRTPRTPITPSNVPTVYHEARQSFVRSANPGRLVGRDTERKELDTFIRDGIDRRAGRCLYVSGPPGTGKSALVREVCQEFATGTELRKAFVNCMSVKSPGDIYKILFNELIGEDERLGFEQNSDLYSLIAPKKKSAGPVYLVILDEIDHLLDLDLEVLYALFELALRQSSRLILIGIANALDLTDRFLPRLKARNLKPQLLPFLPYTALQVASVITAKLRALLANDESTHSDYVPFVHPTAIEFCSKKIASQTGDLRKAFDIIHHSLALLENETKQMLQKNISVPISPSKSPLSENPNLSSPSRPRTLAASLATTTPTTAPRVTIAHIARVTASVLGHGTSQRLQTLNLQQKAALCALRSLEKKKQLRRWQTVLDTPSKSAVNSSITIRDLYGTYSLLCKRDNAVQPLTAVEFCDVIGGLETLGLVGEGDARGIKKGTPGKKAGKREDRRVSCWISEKELETCLDGAGGALLRGLLVDD
ncbi:MAG: hypothetical protein Q9225_002740 [Loekoesia sp. 1 TL-2023]